MPARQPADPARAAPILWRAQFSGVLIITALAWFLPDLVPIEPIPGVPIPLIIAAVASVPVVFVIARLLGVGAGQKEIRIHGPLDQAREKEPGDNARKLGRYLVVIALAELPAILAIAYVFSGGPRNHALALGALALAMLLALPPRKAGIEN